MSKKPGRAYAPSIAHIVNRGAGLTKPYKTVRQLDPNRVHVDAPLTQFEHEDLERRGYSVQQVSHLGDVVVSVAPKRERVTDAQLVARDLRRNAEAIRGGVEPPYDDLDRHTLGIALGLESAAKLIEERLP